jgi:hypothetical protein
LSRTELDRWSGPASASTSSTSEIETARSGWSWVRCLRLARSQTGGLLSIYESIYDLYLPIEYRGKCVCRLIVKLVDGTYHRAVFDFGGA